MEYNYATIRLTSWHEYKMYVQQLSENWAFRGQASSNWLLNNAIERTDFINFRNNIEADLVAEFQRGARNYLSSDHIPGHLIEWVALMQHHGAPTRLLDLTRSPFIAAYFAYEFCYQYPGNYVAIWCLNIEHLRAKAVQWLEPEFSSTLKETKNLINEKLFEILFYQNRQQLVFPVEPFRMNRRYSLQQSVFVSTGTSQLSLMQQLLFLGDDLARTVIKLEVPAMERKEALRDLQKMNLNRASLFPDLDGFALSLRLRYNSMKAPEEIQKEARFKEEDLNYPFIP